MTPIEQMAEECGILKLHEKELEGDVYVVGDVSIGRLKALREAIIKDFVSGLENPVAWTSPDRSVLHRVTKDTFFGSHTIPLFDLSQWRDK